MPDTKQRPDKDTLPEEFTPDFIKSGIDDAEKFANSGGSSSSESPQGSQQKSDLAEKEADATENSSSSTKKDTANEDIPFERNQSNEQTKGRINRILRNRYGISAGAIGSISGIIIALFVLFAPVLGIPELADLLSGFHTGSNDGFRVTRAAKMVDSFRKGGIAQVSLDRKIGNFDGKITQTILGKAKLGKADFFRRASNALERRGARVGYKEFVNAKGETINANGKQELPTDITERSGKYYDINIREQGLEGRTTADVAASQKSLSKLMRNTFGTSVTGLVNRAYYAKSFQARSGLLGFTKRMGLNFAGKTEEIGARILASRTRIDIDSPESNKESTGKKVIAEIRKGSTRAKAKLKVGLDAIAEKGGKGTSISLLALTIGCYVQDQYENIYLGKQKVYDSALISGLDLQLLGDEVKNAFANPGQSTLSLEVLGEFNEHLIATERVQQEPIRVGPQEYEIRESTYVDSAFETASYFAAAGINREGIAILDEFNVFLDNETRLEQLGDTITQLDDLIALVPGASLGAISKLCDAPFFGEITNIIGTVFDLAGCSVGVAAGATTGGVASAGVLGACMAKEYGKDRVFGAALGFALDRGINALINNEVGAIPETIAQETEISAMGLSELDNLQSRAGLPVSSEQFLAEARTHQSNELDKLAPVDRFFAIAPGTPGLKLAEWKTKASSQSIMETATETIAAIPSLIVSSISNIANVFTGTAQAQEELDADIVFFNQQKRSLSYLVDDLPDDDPSLSADEQLDESVSYLERIGNREACVYWLFYEFGQSSACNGFVPADQRDSELAKDFSGLCMGLDPGSLTSGPVLVAELMLYPFNGFEELDEQYKELCEVLPLQYKELYITIGTYSVDLQTVEGLETLWDGPTAVTSTANNPVGLECPELVEHPTEPDYVRMADDPGELWSWESYTPESQRYGSRALICAAYTAARNFEASQYGSNFKINMGDLTAGAGHVSHKNGVDLDLDASGAGGWAADHTKGSYSDDATAELGKAFIDTGIIKTIYWCEPGATPKPGGVPIASKHLRGRVGGSMDQIRDYAQSKGLEVQIYCIENHSNHFHVRINDEFRLSRFGP